MILNYKCIRIQLYKKMPPWGGQNAMHNYRVVPIKISNLCISYTRVMTTDLALVSKILLMPLGVP